MYTFRNHIATRWGPKEIQIIGLIDQRHVLIKLASAHDLARVWTIESYQMESIIQSIQMEEEFSTRC